MLYGRQMDTPGHTMPDSPTTRASVRIHHEGRLVSRVPNGRPPLGAQKYATIRLLQARPIYLPQAKALVDSEAAVPVILYLLNSYSNNFDPNLFVSHPLMALSKTGLLSD